MRTLEQDEREKAWDAFDDLFRFRPSIGGPFPAILEPSHSITFTFRTPGYYVDTEVDELRDVIFHAFSEAIGPSKEVYYLDWQHECFGVKIDATPSELTGYPDGDYAIFLSEDMQSGTFGHPWEHSICFFGDEFVKQVLGKRPAILGNAIRNKGSYAL